MRESVIQDQLLAWLRGSPRSGYAVNIHGDPMQERGIPDILSCWKGRLLGIEVKVPGGNPDETQVYHIDSILAAGGIAFCAHSLHEAQDILENWE